MTSFSPRACARMLLLAVGLVVLAVAVAVARADGLAVVGPTTVPAHTMVRLTAAGVPQGARVIWDVCGPNGSEVDDEECGGRLLFAAPPGKYRVKLRAIPADKGPVIAARAWVTVQAPEPAPGPQPPPGPGGTPTPPGAAPTPPAPGKPPGAQYESDRAICKVVFGTSGCTTTAIAPRAADGTVWFLCAAHCLGADQGVVTDQRGRSVRVRIAARDAASDVTWLASTSPVPEDWPLSKLAAGDPPVGTPVWQAGHGVRTNRARKDGKVLGRGIMPGQVAFSAPVSSGDSGGPVFRSDTNEVIATVCCIVGGAGGTYSSGCGAARARELLAGLNAPGRPVPAGGPGPDGGGVDAPEWRPCPMPVFASE